MKQSKNYFLFKDYLYLAIGIALSIFILINNNKDLVLNLKSLSLSFFDQIMPELTNPLIIYQLKNENIYLKEALLRINQQHNDFIDLKKENSHLREMLGLQQKNDYKYIYGKVLARNPESYPFTLLINIGWKDGIAIDDIAINARGLIGIIIECSRDYARVKMICSPENRIAVRTEIDRIPGIMHPLNEETAEIKEITKTQKISKTEKIFTSAFSTIYPDGLQIGTVSEVSDTLATSHKFIKIKYGVDFTVLEDLFIIKRQATINNIKNN